MNGIDEVKAAAETMLSLYGRGEYHTLLAQHFTPDALLLLSNRPEPVCGVEEISRLLSHKGAANAFLRHTTNMRFSSSKISEDVFVLYGSADPDKLPLYNVLPREKPANLSCGFKKTAHGYRLFILHTSIPIAEQSLFHAANDLYGAVFLCRADESCTLIEMNESFISLFGYTREEISTRFSSCFSKMVDPADRHLLRCAEESAATGAIRETELRVTAKGGAEKWLLQRRQLFTGENGQSYFRCILMDISAIKKLQLDLMMSLERHEIILNQSNDIIFEWDIPGDRFTASANWEKLFRYPPLSGNLLKVAGNFTHPDDRKTLETILESILSGAPYAECEVRVKRRDGVFLWCRMRATQQFEASGTVIKAIGIISDIDEEKRRSQHLLEKAERDALTGLYNKGTVQALIAEYLASRRKDSADALLIIDIDNFKRVNDTEGHLFGDKFLVHAAGCLSRIFRSTDLIGRIGGDEFIVLAKDVPSLDIIRQKAEQTVHAFRTVSEEEKPRFSVSCSVGVALADGRDIKLDTLYSKADRALYQAKRNGKNRYVLYEGDLSPY